MDVSVDVGLGLALRSDGTLAAWGTDVFGTASDAPTDAGYIDVATGVYQGVAIQAVVDTDGDGLSDADETDIYGTDPTLADTDGDTLTDGFEIEIQEFGCPSPLAFDTDLDGLSDGQEHELGLDLCNDSDVDGDGLGDSLEVLEYLTDPFDPDTDDDGLLDGTEVDLAEGGLCPNPLDPDSDGDTLLDGTEVDAALGTDPCSEDSDGDGVTDPNDDEPTTPGVSTGFLEDALRALAQQVMSMDLDEFAGPNDNAKAGRRAAVARSLYSAANSVAAEAFPTASKKLGRLGKKLDDLPTPPDWMIHTGSGAKGLVQSEVAAIEDLIAFEL